MSKKRSASKKSGPAAKKTRAAKKRARGPLSVATSSGKPVKERVAALMSMPLSGEDIGEQIEALLELLRDREQPIQVRLTALQSLGAARFASPAFAANQGEYTATLREVAEDPDPELRQRALGILAREKDGFAQTKLLEGLREPSKSLVPPEKALQLLGNDVHAEAYPIAREIVRNPPNPLAKREALRLLAADAASAPSFEAILRDKAETPEIRQISAAALHALNPVSLQAHAREILLDPSEHEEMHQTSLTALTEFGAPEIATDQALKERVDQLSTEAPEGIRDSARQFIGKFGR
jgi:hypothetical protein